MLRWEKNEIGDQDEMRKKKQGQVLYGFKNMQATRESNIIYAQVINDAKNIYEYKEKNLVRRNNNCATDIV